MAIRTSGIITGFSASDFVRMKEKLGDLQRQLGSGQKAETYGGLGNDRGFSLAFRGSVSRIDAWQQNISLVSTRISIIDTSLDGIQKAIATAKGALKPEEFTLSGGRTIGQVAASEGLGALVSMLNSGDGTRYMFGGRKTATPPVAEPALFLNGDTSRAGFKTVLMERMQADLGSASASPETDPAATGRLALSAAGAQPVTLGEDGVHDFGLKLGIVTGAVDGLAVTEAAGPPKSVAIAAGAGNAAAGQSLTLSFSLPDGSVERISLTAAASDASVVGPGEFQIGATSAETLDNLRAALGTQVGALVGAKLAAASAARAGEDFFKGETNPAALAGPPAVEPGVAKRLVAGPSGTMADAVAYDTPQNADARTVRWYQGDRQSASARETAVAEVDNGRSVSYGVRADEEALRMAVQHMAVAGTLTFDAADPHALERYQALTPRIASGLSMEGATQTIEGIRIEIAAANTTANSAKTRHGDQRAMMVGLISDIEGVDDNEVAVHILALQTNLQASYQTSSMLSKLSLINYL